LESSAIPWALQNLQKRPETFGKLNKWKSCILKRKQLDDLLEEQTRLQKELEGEEDTLEQMHQKHVDIMQVQLEGERQQKRDYELKLEQKMLRLERMQEEYQQLEEELQPFIETVQSQIEKLETMSTCCEQVHAATSPNIVDAIAAADLPSMNSGNSDDSIGEHLNKAN
jgi:chromosome segregation ATPase